MIRSVCGMYIHHALRLICDRGKPFGGDFFVVMRLVMDPMRFGSDFFAVVRFVISSPTVIGT